MKRIALALAAVAVSASALAQSTATNVQGVVTTMQNGQLVNVTQGMQLPEGATLNFAPGARVTVQFSAGGGCTATLSSGASFPLTAGNCQAFAAKAGTTTVAQGGAFSGVFTGPVALTVGAVGGLAVLREATRNNNTQPTIVLPISPI